MKGHNEGSIAERTTASGKTVYQARVSVPGSKTRVNKTFPTKDEARA